MPVSKLRLSTDASTGVSSHYIEPEQSNRLSSLYHEIKTTLDWSNPPWQNKTGSIGFLRADEDGSAWKAYIEGVAKNLINRPEYRDLHCEVNSPIKTIQDEHETIGGGPMEEDNTQGGFRRGVMDLMIDDEICGCISTVLHKVSI